MRTVIARAWVVAAGVLGASAAAEPVAGPEADVSRERVMAELRALPVKRAAWGDKEGMEGLRATERMLVEKLTALGYAPELDPVDHIGGRLRPGSEEDLKNSTKEPWNNIVVEIPGRTCPSEVLIFGAHFDAMPTTPGADDNGTGVACLLEMARVLKDRPMQRTVRLLFFNLEEAGLVGSRVYVQRNREKWGVEDEAKGAEDAGADTGRETILGMVSVEMIGYYTDAPNSQRSPIPPSPLFTPPTVGDFLGIGGLLRFRHFSQPLARAMQESAPGLPLVNSDFLPMPVPDLMRSDHAPFWQAGVPAVIVTDTSEFRNPNYHKESDTVESLDPERFTLAVRSMVGAAWRLAGPVGGELPALAAPRKKTAPAAPAGTPGTEPPAPADAPIRVPEDEPGAPSDPAKPNPLSHPPQ